MFFNIIRYSIKNIFRNKFLTLSTILVLTLLMFFINVLQLLDSISEKIISEINSKMSISLYLKDWLNQDSLEVSSLKNNIKEKVNEKIIFEYKTKEESLKEMQQREPEAARILENENNPLPETIVLSNIEIEEYWLVNSFIENQIWIFLNNENKDYFANYKTQYDRIKQVIFILDTLKIWLKVIISTFFISIAIITYSVIWNFVYFYKNEIYITRLVWWAKKFIYWPFVLQGIIYSIISFSIWLVIFYLLLKNLKSAFWEYFIFEIDFYVTVLYFFIFIFIWWISWYLSSKKYLKTI